MKRIILFLFLSISLVFLSCKKDDPGLEGAWELTEFGFTIEDMEGSVLSSGTGFNFELVLFFEENTVSRTGVFDLLRATGSDTVLYRNLTIFNEENTWSRDDDFLYINEQENGFELEYSRSKITLTDESVSDELVNRLTMVLIRADD